MYNAGIIPCVPEKGSLGASGDLGPLAYIALVATGAWRAKYQGEIMSGEEALKRAGLEAARLSYKEGLAMINGTSMMVGVAAPLLYGAKRLVKQFCLVSAISLEALKGKIMPYHPTVHKNKPHPGQIKVAGAIWTTLAPCIIAWASLPTEILPAGITTKALMPARAAYAAADAEVLPVEAQITALLPLCNAIDKATVIPRLSLIHI